MYCKKCRTGRSGDKVGDPCRTEGCDGTIEDVKFSDLVDVLPEPMTCGRRDRGEAGQDRWQKFKRIDNRVCSYCGSLHPDDLFRLVRACAASSPDALYRSVVEIDPSDKSYKIYVHQPGVRNAHEGGIKFYTHHLPHDESGKIDVPDERNREYAAALAATRERFRRSRAFPSTARH